MSNFAGKRKAALNAFTREEIRKAANGIISMHGIKGLRMSLVAEAAGLAKGTLYNYYKDKGALIAHVIFKAIEPLADLIERISASDSLPAEQLSLVVQKILETALTHQDSIREAMQERLPPPRDSEFHNEMRQMRNRMLEAIKTIMERGIKMGEFRVHQTGLTAHIFLASIQGLLGPRLMKEEDFTMEEEVSQLMSIFIEGIGSRKRKPSRKN